MAAVEDHRQAREFFEMEVGVGTVGGAGGGAEREQREEEDGEAFHGGWKVRGPVQARGLRRNPTRWMRNCTSRPRPTTMVPR